MRPNQSFLMNLMQTLQNQQGIQGVQGMQGTQAMQPGQMMSSVNQDIPFPVFGQNNAIGNGMGNGFGNGLDNCFGGSTPNFCNTPLTLAEYSMQHGMNQLAQLFYGSVSDTLTQFDRVADEMIAKIKAMPVKPTSSTPPESDAPEKHAHNAPHKKPAKHYKTKIYTDKALDKTEGSGKQEKTEGAENKENTESTGNKKETESAENKGNTESAGNQKQTEGAGNKEATTGADNQKQTEGADNKEATTGADNQKQTEGADNQKQTEGADDKEKTESTDNQGATTGAGNNNTPAKVPHATQEGIATVWNNLSPELQKAPYVQQQIQHAKDKIAAANTKTDAGDHTEASKLLSQAQVSLLNVTDFKGYLGEIDLASEQIGTYLTELGKMDQGNNNVKDAQNRAKLKQKEIKQLKEKTIQTPTGGYFPVDIKQKAKEAAKEAENKNTFAHTLYQNAVKATQGKVTIAAPQANVAEIEMEASKAGVSYALAEYETGLLPKIQEAKYATLTLKELKHENPENPWIDFTEQEVRFETEKLRHADERIQKERKHYEEALSKYQQQQTTENRKALIDRAEELTSTIQSEKEDLQESIGVVKFCLDRGKEKGFITSTFDMKAPEPSETISWLGSIDKAFSVENYQTIATQSNNTLKGLQQTESSLKEYKEDFEYFTDKLAQCGKAPSQEELDQYGKTLRALYVVKDLQQDFKNIHAGNALDNSSIQTYFDTQNTTLVERNKRRATLATKLVYLKLEANELKTEYANFRQDETLVAGGYNAVKTLFGADSTRANVRKDMENLDGQLASLDEHMLAAETEGFQSVYNDVTHGTLRDHDTKLAVAPEAKTALTMPDGTQLKNYRPMRDVKDDGDGKAAERVDGYMDSQKTGEQMIILGGAGILVAVVALPVAAAAGAGAVGAAGLEAGTVAATIVGGTASTLTSAAVGGVVKTGVSYVAEKAGDGDFSAEEAETAFGSGFAMGATMVPAASLGIAAEGGLVKAASYIPKVGTSKGVQVAAAGLGLGVVGGAEGAVTAAADTGLQEHIVEKKSVDEAAEAAWQAVPTGFGMGLVLGGIPGAYRGYHGKAGHPVEPLKIKKSSQKPVLPNSPEDITDAQLVDWGNTNHRTYEYRVIDDENTPGTRVLQSRIKGSTDEADWENLPTSLNDAKSHMFECLKENAAAMATAQQALAKQLKQVKQPSDINEAMIENHYAAKGEKAVVNGDEVTITDKAGNTKSQSLEAVRQEVADEHGIRFKASSKTAAKGPAVERVKPEDITQEELLADVQKWAPEAKIENEKIVRPDGEGSWQEVSETTLKKGRDQLAAKKNLTQQLQHVKTSDDITPEMIHDHYVATQDLWVSVDGDKVTIRDYHGQVRETSNLRFEKDKVFIANQDQIPDAKKAAPKEAPKKAAFGKAGKKPLTADDITDEMITEYYRRIWPNSEYTYKVVGDEIHYFDSKGDFQGLVRNRKGNTISAKQFKQTLAEAHNEVNQYNEMNPKKFNRAVKKKKYRSKAVSHLEEVLGPNNVCTVGDQILIRDAEGNWYRMMGKDKVKVDEAQLTNDLEHENWGELAIKCQRVTDQAVNYKVNKNKFGKYIIDENSFTLDGHKTTLAEIRAKIKEKLTANNDGLPEFEEPPTFWKRVFGKKTPKQNPAQVPVDDKAIGRIYELAYGKGNVIYLENGTIIFREGNKLYLVDKNHAIPSNFNADGTPKTWVEALFRFGNFFRFGNPLKNLEKTLKLHFGEGNVQVVGETVQVRNPNNQKWYTYDNGKYTEVVEDAASPTQTAPPQAVSGQQANPAAETITTGDAEAAAVTNEGNTWLDRVSTKVQKDLNPAAPAEIAVTTAQTPEPELVTANTPGIRINNGILVKADRYDLIVGNNGNDKPVYRHQDGKYVLIDGTPVSPEEITLRPYRLYKIGDNFIELKLEAESTVANPVIKKYPDGTYSDKYGYKIDPITGKYLAERRIINGKEVFLSLRDNNPNSPVIIEDQNYVEYETGNIINATTGEVVTPVVSSPAPVLTPKAIHEVLLDQAAPGTTPSETGLPPAPPVAPQSKQPPVVPTQMPTTSPTTALTHVPEHPNIPMPQKLEPGTEGTYFDSDRKLYIVEGTHQPVVVGIKDGNPVYKTEDGYKAPNNPRVPEKYVKRTLHSFNINGKHLTLQTDPITGMPIVTKNGNFKTVNGEEINPHTGDYASKSFHQAKNAIKRKK